MARHDLVAGSPGVFRPLRHLVPHDARHLLVRGREVYFAMCGAPCWPPAEFALDLPWCSDCWTARRRSRASDRAQEG